MRQGRLVIAMDAWLAAAAAGTHACAEDRVTANKILVGG
jgi:hypothetical protein